uniref:Choline/ethanolaminephosphotransferase 1-like isoform X1 n=1 Tax=Tanacetum cinerariifolium TaxID=118510 RepID=A0A699I4T8_TANCI|nr:choline/ethanolaminephosphotransferase 1-like isoform X1 [Tanacetum cinerariifolium]
MPPNMITLMGFMFLSLSAVLGFIYSPHLDTAPPRWVNFAHGLLLFLYQTFDAVDGKQARRTNSSSPLGELFDHGCDALACALEALAFASTAMCGRNAFWFWVISAIPFYLATWEQFLQLFLNNQLKDLPEPFNDTYATPCHTKKVFSNMARKNVNFSGEVTSLFDSMLVQNQAPEGEGSTIPPEPQPTPSTSQPTAAEPQTATPQIAVSQIIFHEAYIEPILQSPTIYQRKRKTQKRRTQKDTELLQTSVPLNLGADEAVHKEGVLQLRLSLLQGLEAH